MERIEVFKTSDGVLFEDDQEAQKHQAKLDFSDWYIDNKLYGNYVESHVDSMELLEWLEENKEMVKKIIEEV